MRILGWEERVQTDGMSERDAMLAELDELRSAFERKSKVADFSVECDLSSRQVSMLAREAGLTDANVLPPESPIYAFAAALRAYTGGRRPKPRRLATPDSAYQHDYPLDPYSPEQIAARIGLTWPSLDLPDASTHKTLVPSWVSAPLVPTAEMIEEGAKAIAQWDDNCVWPDSWGADAQRHRNDALKAYRAMVEFSPAVKSQIEANRTLDALQRLAFCAVILAYYTAEENLEKAQDSALRECYRVGIMSSQNAFDWLNYVLTQDPTSESQIN